MQDEKFKSGGHIVHNPMALCGADDPSRSEQIIPQEIIDKLVGLANKITIKMESKEDLKISRKYPYAQFHKIGIGITTHNRPDAFSKTLSHIIAFFPPNAHVVTIDDCSDTPYASFSTGSNKIYYRFDRNVGIARAKNKALELLYNAGCEHLFLFDDDTFPLVDDWWMPYVESGENHLMYIFQQFANAPGPHDMIEYYRDDKIAAYSHVRGCMLYYRRVCLDTVGGMDVAFGKWGHEHGDLSNRIYSAGLTRFRYMDVANSKGLFYAADEQEHGKFKSTVPGHQRIDLLNASKAIYEAQYNKPFYRGFRDVADANVGDKNPLFLTAYFTTLEDTQRPGQKWEFDSSVLERYLMSILGISGNRAASIVLNDNLNHEWGPSIWEKVPVYGNPYFQRWMSYYDYLIKHKDSISWVFMTDCTDVELLKMPEPQPGFIYMGDEPDLIGKSTWLQYHHKHSQLQTFYKKFGVYQMVNAGILGGYVDDVLPFIRAIIDTYVQMLHESIKKHVNGPGMTDMGIFNYVAYTQFRDKISHGPHVNTRFKANERNDISWFKHK